MQGSAARSGSGGGEQHDYAGSCLSPESRRKAILRGQWELMEMVKKMPAESGYELTLKDLVVLQSGSASSSTASSRSSSSSSVFEFDIDQYLPEPEHEPAPEPGQQVKMTMRSSPGNGERVKMTRSDEINKQNWMMMRIVDGSLKFREKKKDEHVFLNMQEVMLQFPYSNLKKKPKQQPKTTNTLMSKQQLLSLHQPHIHRNQKEDCRWWKIRSHDDSDSRRRRSSTSNTGLKLGSCLPCFATHR